MKNAMHESLVIIGIILAFCAGGAIAASGKDTITMASGLGCSVQAGENGCFATAFFDEKTKRNRIVTACEGK